MRKHRIYLEETDGEGSDLGGADVSAEVPVADVKPDVNVEAKPDAKPDTQPDAKPEVKPDWPEDWRQKAAAGDEKKLARLSKYASPQAVADALIAAQNRISQGDLNPVLKKDATPEQIKEYREAMGIPESPDKYDLGKIDVTEADKPLIDQVLKRAHDMNLPPEMAKANVDAYFAIKEQIQAQRQQDDATYLQQSEDSLRAEWGSNYRRNVNLINSMMDGAPAGLKDRLLTGRLADGSPIGSDPDTLRWLLGLELQRNPTATVVPGAGGNMGQTVADEIRAIETKMRENRKAYDRDEKLQSRYRQLIEYQLTEKKKAA